MGRGLGKIAGAGLGIAAAYATGGGFTSAFARAMGLLGVNALLQSSQRIQGAQLQDLGVQISTENAELLLGHGVWRQGMNIVWASKKREHVSRSSSGGKGGPKIETFNYDCDLYMVGGFGQITRLRELKIDTEWIYEWNDGDEKGFTLNDAGDYWYAVKGETILRVYKGTLNQPVDATIETAKGVGQWTAYPGLYGISLTKLDLGPWNGNVGNITTVWEYSVVDVPSIILRLAGLVGFTADYFDLSAIDGLELTPGTSFTVDTRKTAAAAIGELMDRFHFWLPEEDGIFVAKLKSAGPIRTLAVPETRIHTPDQPTPNTVYESPDERQLSEVYEVAFRDVDRQNNPGQRRNRRRIYAGEQETYRTRRKKSESLSGSFKSNEAQALSRVRQAEEWASAQAAKPTVGPRNIDLSPGDVLNVPQLDGNRRVYVEKVEMALFGPATLTTPKLNQLVYNLPLPSLTSGNPNTGVREYAAPRLFLADMPPVSENNPNMISGPVMLIAASQLPTYKWAPAVISIERQEGGGWSELADVTMPFAAVMGELTAPYTPGSRTGFDAAAEIEMTLYAGTVASAESRSVAAHGANLMLFETGLYVSFVNESQTSDMAYTLSDIWPGRHGSDYAAAGYGDTLPTGTRFIMLTDAEARVIGSVHAVSIPANWRGIRARVRGLTKTPQGEMLRSYRVLQSDDGVYRARNMEPLSPLVLVATRDEDGDFRLHGTPRTRLISNDSEVSGTAARLGEPEFGGQFKFRVTLTDGVTTVAVDKYTNDELGVFDWTWTAAELATAFGGTPGAISGTVAIYGNYGPGRVATFAE